MRLWRWFLWALRGIKPLSDTEFQKWLKEGEHV
jgi:hypothetical protein